MKAFILLILICSGSIISTNAFAVRDTTAHYYSFSHKRERDTLYLASSQNRSDYTRAIKNAKQVISLYVEPNWNSRRWIDQKYTAHLKGTVISVNRQSRDASLDTTDFSLCVDYNMFDSKTYKTKDVFIYSPVANSTFTVLNIDMNASVIQDSSGNNISLNNIPQVDMIFRIGNQVQCEVFYPGLTPSMLSTNGNITYNVDLVSQKIEFLWQKNVVAEYYDFEWCYIDDYSFNATGRKSRNEIFNTSDNIPYVEQIKKQSARVSISDTTYELPLVFESGYIIVKVRSNGRTGQYYNQHTFGEWKEQIIDIGSLGNGNSFTADKMNWQYQAFFSDDGKRKDVLSFHDGTFRERQNMVSLNTENNILVSETIYDHQGRPAIQILPAPVIANNNNSPALKYYGSFNINEESKPYSKFDFDTTSQDCEYPLPAKLSSASGAGKYYSSANSLGSINNYVPDAEGYPFIQTEYMPDPTGRIRSSGMAGRTHQIGSGHQKSYRYAQPEQEELDKLFGNNIGYAAYYDKISMTDENGQQLVTYKDGKGNIVATALAGSSPAMLDSLEKQVKQLNVNLIDESNVVDSISHTISAVKNMDISIPTELILDYSIVGTHFKTNVPGIRDSLCMDCVYDMKVSIVNACGVTVFEDVQTIGDLSDSPQSMLFDCENNAYLKRDTVFIAEPGTYILNKVVVVNEAAQRKYEEEYLKLQLVDTLKQKLIDVIPGDAIYTDCAECTPCNYIQDSIILPDSTKIFIQIKDSTQDVPCFDYCPGSVSSIQGFYESMLRDVSPGGQYGSYQTINYTNQQESTSRDIVSVFNDENKLGTIRYDNLHQLIYSRSWKFPAFPYRNSDGTLAKIAYYDDEGNLDYTASPNSFGVSLNKFIQNWQPSWAASLVPYHPEYGYYEWMLKNKDIIDYGENLKFISSYAQAVANDATNVEALKNQDPLYNNSDYSERFQNILNRFLRGPYPFVNYYLSVEEAVRAVVNCSWTNDFTEVIDCLNYDGSRLYAETANTILTDKEWNYLKSFYLSARQKLLDSLRYEYVRDRPGSFTNDCIGAETFENANFDFSLTQNTEYTEGLEAPENANGIFSTQNRSCCSYINGSGDEISLSLYLSENRSLCDSLRKKNKIFYNADDVFDYIDTSIAFQSGSTIVYETCGKCIETYQLSLLLNAFFETGSLVNNVASLPSAPPLILFNELRQKFSNPVGNLFDVDFNKSPEGKRLDITIRNSDAREDVFFLNLSSENPINWNAIKSLSCLETSGEHSFTIKAYLDNDSIVNLTGYTESLNLTDCKLKKDCKLNNRTATLKPLLQYVLRNENSYFFSSGTRPLPSVSARQFFNTNNINARLYFWNFISKVPNGNADRYNNEVLELFMPLDLFQHIYSRRSGSRLQQLLFIDREYTSFLKNTFFNPDSLYVVLNIIQYLRSDLAPQKFKKYLRACPVIITNPNRNLYSFSSFGDNDLFSFELPLDIDSGSCKQHKVIFTSSDAGNQKKQQIEIESQCFSLIDCCAEKGNSPLCCIPRNFTGIQAFPIDSVCENDAKEYERITRDRWIEDYLPKKLDSIRAAYYRKCLGAIERFNISYNAEIYHYTLYYYDRAGNLVKTVPPAGVAFLDNTQIIQSSTARRTNTPPVYPQHRLATTYEYNSLNQVIKSTSPDGGTTLYCYDEAGRIILSQNAYHAQRKRAIYTLYDVLGRIIETGECSSNIKDSLTGRMVLRFDRETQRSISVPERLYYFPYTLFYREFAEKINADRSRAEITQTVYDVPILRGMRLYFEYGQQHLRNRIASILFRKKNGAPYDHATHYSYDMHGNVQELVQEYSALARQYPFMVTNQDHVKNIKYEYDLISGKVNRVIYQNGKPDQFVHNYLYDADNRIKEVQTSTSLYEDLATIDIDASYTYYKHGPLARIELGQDKVQGIDYAYTINGWLKAINGDNLSTPTDIGKDGHNNTRVAKDVFGVSLGYFDGDYTPAGGNTAAAAINPIQHEAFTGRNLYNGNIRNMVTANAAFTNPVLQTLYHYDQLNRLKDMQVFETNTSGVLVATEKYRNSFIYDANSNILTQLRKDGIGLLFDTMVYHYKPSNNQLTHVLDNVPANLNSYDIDNQEPNNYRYDAIGRLSTDRAEGLDSIHWANHSKPYFIAKNSGDTVRFTYDGLSRRITKTYQGKTTLYVKDAMGMVMATYIIDSASTNLDEKYIYGNNRLGIYKQDNNQTANQLVQYRGQKEYELTNHLGNVLSVVADIRIVDTVYNGYDAKVITASDYYAFGMEMEERRSGLNFRFGFNGLEKDDEVKGVSKELNYISRSYDPRLCRFKSVDLLANTFPFYSPYQFAGNTPLQAIDLDGKEEYHYTRVKDESGKTIELKLTNVKDLYEWQWNPHFGGTSMGFTLWEKVKNQKQTYVVHQQNSKPLENVSGDIVDDIYDESVTFNTYAEALNSSDDDFSFTGMDILHYSLQGLNNIAVEKSQSTHLKLKMKPGWTPEQQLAARKKVAALSDGNSVVVKKPVRKSDGRGRFKKAGGKVGEDEDVDHVRDLQLGGLDEVGNMTGLDKSVNRSVGSQIQHKIKPLAEGTKIDKVTIGSHED